MTIQTKREIITQITLLLAKLTETEEETPSAVVSTADKPVEMLTVRECTELIKGLKAYTVRQLVKQGKVKSIRTGEGNRGKILVNKADLIRYSTKSNILDQQFHSDA